MVQGLAHAHFQGSRTMWASIETLFATVVACAPSIYSLLRRGRENNSIHGSSVGNNALRGSRPSAGSSVAAGKSSFGGNTTSRKTSMTSSGTLTGRPRTRHSSIFSNYMSSSAGLYFDTIEGEEIPDFNKHSRGSVSSTIWTHCGNMEEGQIIGERGKEEKEKDKVYVINEEEGGDTKGIMVETTWSQVSEAIDDPNTKLKVISAAEPSRRLERELGAFNV
ncbi:hypothetical protein ABW20_dc0103272 [Dactylellina cionopaga]|nr:hypothetical protein ABW20_dc0103272 [Dactylellina cionopaga]